MGSLGCCRFPETLDRIRMPASSENSFGSWKELYLLIK